MNEHTDVQTELPDHAAGRLAPAARARVEAHLAGCQECRELASDFRELNEAILEGGMPLFGHHPPEAELHRLALGRGGVEDPRLAAHLDVCASCSLEVQGWRRMSRWKPASARPSWRMVALASAAGLVAGVGLAALAMRAPWQPPPPAPVIGAAVGPQIFLPPVMRGEPGRVLHQMDPDQQTVVVAWPAAIPHEARPEESFRFEIGPPGSKPSWSQEMTASEVRRHLETAEVVTFLVPAAAWRPGLQEARVLGAADAGAAPIYQALIEVRIPATN